MGALRKKQANEQRAVVLVDMDGTIADASRRERKFLRAKRKDWAGFFRDMENDPPIASVMERVRELAQRYDIVILTGRPEKYRTQTEAWLAKQELPYTRLLMRKHGDRRPDFEAKAALLAELDQRRIVLALDDRPPVCAAYRELGIRVIEIASNLENQLTNETYRLMA